MSAPNPIDTEIGARVRALREAAGLSQHVLAARAGVKRPAVSLIEAGQQSLALRDVEAYASALGVPPLALFPKRWRSTP